MLLGLHPRPGIGSNQIGLPQFLQIALIGHLGCAALLSGSRLVIVRAPFGETELPVDLSRIRRGA